MEQALRLPEGRRGGRHPQAREVQGLHHRRLGGPGQDLRGAGRHQVLPGAQRPHPGAVPQAPARELDAVDQRQRRPQPARRRPLQLHGAQPHRPLALLRHERRGGPRAPEVGELRPHRHRREPQLPQQEHRRGEEGPLHATHRGRHQERTPHEGAHALGHPGEQPPARPAQPDRAHHRGRRRLPRGHRRHPLHHTGDPRGAAALQRVEQAARRGAHDRELRRDGQRRLLQAARRAHHRAQPQAHHEVLRRGERHLPHEAAAAVVPDADRPRGRAAAHRRAQRHDRAAHLRPVPATGLREAQPAQEVRGPLRRHMGQGLRQPGAPHRRRGEPHARERPQAHGVLCEQLPHHAAPHPGGLREPARPARRARQRRGGIRRDDRLGRRLRRR